MDAVAPALLVAQAIGRIGNYFDQQPFGKPSTLPWALEISRAARLSAGMPAADLRFTTFQPSFLYELIFDLALAAALVWLGHHRRIRPPGLFALYVAGYSGYRIFEETIRIDSSAYFLGLRLNFFVAIVVTVAGLIWFVISQRKGREAVSGAAAVVIVSLVGTLAAGCSQPGPGAPSTECPVTPARRAGGCPRCEAVKLRGNGAARQPTARGPAAAAVRRSCRSRVTADGNPDRLCAQL